MASNPARIAARIGSAAGWQIVVGEEGGGLARAGVEQRGHEIVVAESRQVIQINFVELRDRVGVDVDFQGVTIAIEPRGRQRQQIVPGRKQAALPLDHVITNLAMLGVNKDTVERSQSCFLWTDEDRTVEATGGCVDLVRIEIP